MVYSLKDIYGLQASSVLSTTEQTIAETEEQDSYINSDTIITEDGRKEVGKNKIFGAILLFVGVLVLVHFLQ
jgi:hypothetical protein